MIIPSSGLKQSKGTSIREPLADPEAAKTQKAQVRDAIDLMRAVNGYAFLVCACGMKIKLPPEFDKPAINCPKCKRENRIPAAELATIGAMTGILGGSEEITEAVPTRQTDEAPLEYARKTRNWESFDCTCGKRMQLSPAFCSSQMVCSQCGRVIKIKNKFAC
jgi:heat shock protein HtpX